MVYNTRVMLPSAKKDGVRTTQKSCIVYEFLRRCEARYVGRTTQRLADRIKQHVATSIRKKSNTERELQPHLCKNNNAKINCESAIKQHLITNPECAETCTNDNFRIIGQGRSSFHLSALESFYIRLKTQSCVNKRVSLFIGSIQVKNCEQLLVGHSWGQLDVVDMGSPLVPFHLYYVHDTFCIFRNWQQVDTFLSYITYCHENITFTAELGYDDKYHFLILLLYLTRIASPLIFS